MVIISFIYINLIFKQGTGYMTPGVHIPYWNHHTSADQMHPFKGKKVVSHIIKPVHVIIKVSHQHDTNHLPPPPPPLLLPVVLLNLFLNLTCFHPVAKKKKMAILD